MESRNINLDIAKFVAILFVISEHVLSEITITFSNEVNWNLGILIWSFIKINVPVFLIVTAHLSFAGKLNVDTFFLKKLNRIAIPVIFWSLFYYVFYSYSFDGLTISGAIHSVLDGSSMYHLYFMYWFIGLSFFIPFVKLLHERSGKAFVLYFSILVIATSLIPTLNTLLGLGIDFFDATGIAKFGFLMFYAFVPGVSCILFKVNKRKIFTSSLFWFVVYTINALISALIVLYFYYFNGVKIQAILNGGSIFVLISAFAFYNGIMNLKIKDSAAFKKFITFNSSASFGVYLVHPALLYFVLVYIYRPIVSHYTNGSNYLSLAYFIVCVLALYITSVAVTYLTSKVKYLRKCII
ncbi:acyltransferase [Citrobacter sp. Ce104]|uniref:acyltransferase n=1 Tax=Citrobacter TaxID=544 RepID=UPI001561230E|nr:MULTISPECIES: acyltransferase [Citrobacter]MDM3281821.1 acyltransferase [Citrobacter sp. Ce104]NRF76659.1 acyltransferase [Citrobacter braakii]DAP42484.1 MAG TPA: putative O-acyltransferase [Caudoviricetes sp.]